MTSAADFEIFLATVPGLEPQLAAEARAKGFEPVKAVAGGVTVSGGWPEVWRANLMLRGASHVLARVAEFRAMHLAQLDKRARRVPWGEVLRADVPFRVEATCRASRIYHSGAAAQRIERAVRETLGAPPSREADICIKARIDDDLCTLSLETSGEPLHKRGHKEAVAGAPMRETLAALLLSQCGYTGNEPVVDPMCGSGTFVIEAAGIAAGLNPGRSRRFAFEQLATFDAAAWQQMQGEAPPPAPRLRFYGSDHDAGAIRMSLANAGRAGVTSLTEFRQQSIDDLKPPPGSAGLVIVNPPYGLRIGDKVSLSPLYRSLGQTLLARFSGWRVGLVTTDPSLAQATGLPFKPKPLVVPHGGLRVALYQAGPLK